MNHKNTKLAETKLKNHSSSCLKHFSDNLDSEGDVLVFTQYTHFLVPKGVKCIKILAVGASGGSGNAFGVVLNNAGEGGTAISNIDVNAGETIEIFVGARGDDGDFPEGGEGGASIKKFEGGKAANGQAGGGGGGGLFGGGAGSSRDCDSSGGGGGGSGTVVGNLSTNGGGRSDGVVMLTLIKSPDATK